MRRAKQTLHKHIRHAGYARWTRAFVALVLLASLAIPAFNWIDGMKAYAISPEAEKVIGKANKNLSTKFSYDKQGNKWQFNKNGVALLAANIAKQQGGQDAEGVASALSQLTAQQVGGSGKNDTSLYSVDLPTKAKQGITYYDNVSRLSFTMVPDFSMRDGKMVQDRIVYPFMDGGQIVYTAKSNGLKEDIVLSKYVADTLRYSYELKLPDTLSAKLLEDGSVGIYSASPTLFGNISFSNNEDKARIMDARRNGSKDHLMFAIPAPFIKDQNGNAGHTKYLLNGGRLTVVADQLKNLKYPLTVDPSVTVTNSANFETDGNGESNIEYGTDEIRRGSVSGGGLGGWGSQTASLGCDKLVSGQNNGYIYCIDATTVRYAKLSTAGTITGSWQTGTALAQAYTDRGGFVYNGYLYVTGGTFTGTARPDTYYIKLNGDGTMAASWQTGTTLNTSRYFHAATAYNGYAYVIAGAINGTTRTDSIEYATINANGSLSAWTPTTNAPTNRWEHSATIYNGYLYVFGGQSNAGILTDAQYAPINSDGTLGSSWTSTTSIPGFSNRRNTAIAYRGYVYLVGGYNNAGVACTADVRYAMIRADGSLGSWVATTNLPVAAGMSCYSLVAQYHDYIVMYGGQNNAGAKQTGVYSVQVNPAGSTEPYPVSPGNYDTAGRTAFASVTYNNFIYIIAGNQGNTGGAGGMVRSTRYASVDAAGAVGTWNTATGLINNPTTGVSGCAVASNCPGRTNVAAAAHEGYVYIAGGNSNGGGNGTWSDVQSARVCTGTNIPVAGCAQAGDLVNWTTIFADFTTNSPSTYTDANGRSHMSMVIHNGVMYLIGGTNNLSSGYYDQIYYSTLTGSGGAGPFNLSNVNLPSARKGVKSFVSSDRLYVVGGGGGASWNSTVTSENTDVNFVPINPDGTLDNVTGFKDANAVINGGSGSTFAASGSLNSYTTAVYNGQLYVAGGTTGAFVAAQSSVYRTSINADGSLGAWSTTTSFATGRFGQATLAINGYLYIIGGCATQGAPADCNATATGTQRIDYQYTRINNGGSGVTGSWTESTSPGSARHPLGGHTTYNGYIYGLKGCRAGLLVGDTSCTPANFEPSMDFAKVNANGTFGAWGTLNTTGAPTDRIGLSVVASNGYLYAIGGCTTTANTGGGYRCTAFSNTVYYAQILANGNVGNWGTTNVFDTAGRYGQAAVAHNGYIYVSGGCTATVTGTASCSAYENTVRKGTINASNGTVTWGSAGSNFTTARLEHQSLVYNGYFYIIGGCSSMASPNCNGLMGDIQYIALDSSGSFTGSWQTTSFPVARTSHGAVAYNGYLYISGGCTAYDGSSQCSTMLNDVQKAPFTPNGKIGRWEKNPTSLTSGMTYHSMAVVNGYMLTLFGISPTHAYDVYARITTVNVQPRTAKYSKLLTISPTTDVAGVYYNGSLPSGSSVTYKVAPNTGIFGAVTAATQGTGSEPTPFCGVGSIYYVQLMATIDDSTTATFPESSQGNVTDMTVYYRLNATPPPNLRMTGGKWFWNETLRPLDTCKEPNP